MNFPLCICTITKTNKNIEKKDFRNIYFAMDLQVSIYPFFVSVRWFFELKKFFINSWRNNLNNFKLFKRVYNNFRCRDMKSGLYGLRIGHKNRISILLFYSLLPALSGDGSGLLKSKIKIRFLCPFLRPNKPDFISKHLYVK